MDNFRGYFPLDGLGFFVVNSKYGEDVLVSSREGIDELLASRSIQCKEEISHGRHNRSATFKQQSQSLNLLKVLGPAHIWAFGVGIDLVGEFMGWDYAVGKGGAFGALIAMLIFGILYTCVAKIDSEVTSTVASAGGQYAQAKHTIGPLMAFNVGLFMT